MKCPSCKDVELVEVLTTKGVMVDICPQCNGVWLDKGEIFYFTSNSAYLESILQKALKDSVPSSRFDPRTGAQLSELFLPGWGLHIDYSPQSGGIWLDKGELEKLSGGKLDIKIDNSAYIEVTPPEAGEVSPAIKLPNLGLVSGVTLFALYAVLILFLIILSNIGLLPPVVALAIGLLFAGINFILAPFIMDWILRCFYRVKWIPYDHLPEHLRDFLIQECEKNKIRPPRVGIIPDGSPNAFTYGHTPNNARLVLTAGIMDLLQPQELNTVVAHELGHILHWDMLVMTVAHTVPLVLYYIYRSLIRMKTKGRDKSASLRLTLALISYLLYIISEYVVLWFSRIREYFADRYAGESTGSPDILAQALVKIGYGMAGREPDPQRKKKKRRPETEAIKPMGIFDPNCARALAITSYVPHSLGKEVDKENLKLAMRWDLWNPWALYYELQSTHPLIAKRLRALSNQAQAMGKTPYITFNYRKPESYWDEFLADVFISWVPFLGLVLGMAFWFLTANVFYFKAGIVLLGLFYLVKVSFSYRASFFPEINIVSLLKKVKVSNVRGVPCTLKGRIIGRGIPGLVWSEDLVLQDNSGIIFLDYRQPLAIWNFIFGLAQAGKFIGRDVVVTGWYRRAPVPFLEIKTLESNGEKITCYVYNVKVAVAWIMIVVGCLSFLF